MFAILLSPGLGLVRAILATALILAVTLLIRASPVTAGDPLPGETAEFVDGAAGQSLVREGIRTVLGLAGTLAGAGNLLGSNLFNSLAGGAVVAFAHRGEPATAPLAAAVLMVGVSCLAWALLARGHRLTRAESIVLILLYGLSPPLLS